MSDARASAETTTHYAASAAWDYGLLADHLKCQITQAMFRNGAISLEWPPTDGEKAQTVLTQLHGSRYKGYSIWGAGTPKQQRADVEAVLYSNENGHVLLGEERWTTGDVDWFVVRFSDARPA